MKRLRLATTAATTLLVTLLVAAIAYASTTGALHITRAAQRHVAVASPSPPTVPLPSEPSKPTSVPTPVLPTPVPPPTLYPGKTGPFVLDADFIDASHGWALITNCIQPGPEQCTYSTASTVNSGATWSRPVQVGPSFAPTDGDAPRSIRFLNQGDGFVYGHSGAFVTHDGAKTWTNIGIQATFVGNLAIGGGTAWAVTDPCARGVICPFEVRSSVDGGRTWSAPHALPNYSPDIAYAFPFGLILSDVAQRQIQLATSAGAQWRTVTAPCDPSTIRADATTVDGLELWVVCSGSISQAGPGFAQVLFISEDSGQSWRQSLSFPQTGFGSVVASRPLVAFTSTEPATFGTHDGGLSWFPATAEGATFTTIRFSGSEWGWAIDRKRGLWTTTNGGDSWGQAGVVPNTLS